MQKVIEIASQYISAHGSSAFRQNKIMKPAAIALLGLIIILLCMSGNKKRDAAYYCEPTEEEYAVYSAVLNEFYGQNDKVQLIIINDHTVPVFVGKGVESFARLDIKGNFLVGISKRIGISKIGKDTLEDFERKNYNSSPLYYRFLLTRKYLLRSARERKTISRRFGREIRLRYPHSSYVAFSRAGVNKKGNSALVYLKSSLDGCLLILKKIDGNWTISEHLLLWLI
ncbi:MAG: hypothetical protein GY757_11560 [bacterium]|nr:hypothetical protein [bacterium]